MKYFHTALFLALFSLLVCAPMLAQAAECGIAGTAKVASGTEVTRTAEEAKNTYIGADGYWHQCPLAKLTPPKLDCAAANDNPRTWVVGTRTCTTAGEAKEQRGDRSLKHGEVGVWLQRRGQTRGELLEKCVDGQRQTVLAYCRAVK